MPGEPDSFAAGVIHVRPRCPSRSSLQGNRRHQRPLRQRRGVLRFRGHWREVEEDEAVETLKTRLDPFGQADDRPLIRRNARHRSVCGVNGWAAQVAAFMPCPLAYPTGVWYNMRRFHEMRKDGAAE